uniref:ATP-dependent Clp protease proteolytic subunit n=1 Tax=Trithuria filamentosa TaxID=658028 RepID=V9PVW6_9MAGN|nr:clp protease proteolytic subunit [Trithuria filamentosa]AHB38742.1 clp protease proteolytic subunit [Trithuria filamentosa]
MPVGIPKLPFFYYLQIIQAKKDKDDAALEKDKDDAALEKDKDDAALEKDDAKDKKHLIEQCAWVDIFNRLYRERVLFLGAPIENQNGNYLVGLISFLTLQDKTREQFLFINSPGGWVIPGIAIFDAVQLGPKGGLYTICIGVAASMASIVLVGGGTNKRAAFPHARIMVHEPRVADYKSAAGDTCLDVTEISRLRRLLLRIYARKTGKPKWAALKDMKRDYFMKPKEAQRFGIIDLLGFSFTLLFKDGEGNPIPPDRPTKINSYASPNYFEILGKGIGGRSEDSDDKERRYGIPIFPMNTMTTKIVGIGRGGHTR